MVEISQLVEIIGLNTSAIIGLNISATWRVLLFNYYGYFKVLIHGGCLPFSNHMAVLIGIK